MPNLKIFISVAMRERTRPMIDLPEEIEDVLAKSLHQVSGLRVTMNGGLEVPCICSIFDCKMGCGVCVMYTTCLLKLIVEGKAEVMNDYLRPAYRSPEHLGKDGM